MRLTAATAVLLVVLVFAALLLGRFWLGSHLDEFRPRIEAALSRQVAVEAHIGHLAVEWHGLLPEFILRDVRLQDAAGRVDLSLEWISARLATLPLLTGRVDFARLEIDHPVVRVQRRSDGRVVVAGILLPTPSEEPGSPFVDWLLSQREVRITDGRLEWQDQLASGQVLTLPHLQLRLQGNGSHHQFQLSAEAPAEVVRGLKASGTLEAEDSRHLEQWSGMVDARAEFLDVSQLRNYARPPVDWRSGRGGLEFALRFGGAQVQSLQADARLDAVAVTLDPELPELRFDRLSGHLSYDRLPGGFHLAARQLLAQGAAADGAPQVKPADFELRMDANGGSASADVVNLGALAALTESLPVPPELRSALRERAPVGMVQSLLAEWQGSSDRLGNFKLRARLNDVSVQAVGTQPGVRHLSAVVQADQASGTLGIDAQDPILVLPGVFPQPLQLHLLQATAHWSRHGDTTLLSLDRVHFDDPDLVGNLAGTMELQAGVPRRTRLHGDIERFEVTAVPRFLPLLMSPDARHWVSTALRSGHARQATLKIDGDLQEFPFRRAGSGIFQAHVPVDGARLDFAPGWPAITGIRGVVDFEGPGMTVHAIEAHQEHLLAREVVARIPVLDADQPVLELHGQVGGPLQSGFDFIMQSPLKKSLGGFAGSFQAAGDGALDLSVSVPLANADATTLVGELEVDGGSLHDPAGTVPPLTALRGHLHFTDSIVAAENLSARVLGGTVQGSLHSAPDGDVLLSAHGQLEGAEVDSFYGRGRLDFLRGSGDWSGNFRFGTVQTLDIDGHLPAYGAPAEFTIRQHEGPLTVEAHGTPLCSQVVGAFVPALAGSAEGNLDWQVTVRHEDKLADQISGSGQCRLFGHPAEFSLAGHADALTLDLNGNFDGAALAQLVPGLPGGILSGATRWDLHLDERPGQPLIRLASDLRGLRIELPPPFGKPAAEALPLRASIGRLRGASALYLSGGIEGRVGVAGLLPSASNDRLRLAVRIGGAAVLPSTDGIRLSGTLAQFDLAAWRTALQGRAAPRRVEAPATTPGRTAVAADGTPATAASPGLPPFTADLQIEQMSAGPYRFDSHHWQLRSQTTGWHVEVHGAQIEGEADWTDGGSGRLVARLERLWLAGGDSPAGPDSTASEGQRGRVPPALDLDVREFQLDHRPLGHLELRGEPEAGGWQISHLGLSQPHGSLTAQGHWIDGPGQSRTRLDAQLDSPDTGALVLALGYPKALSRGKTQLRASLDWVGDPGDFSVARLGGTLDLDSRTGQFLTLEPGVGRLLGLLSLQALPRRVTLDFRDIFSQGFAFDAITGHFDIDHGTMQTRNLEMTGPAAQVKLSGTVGLVDESQSINVRVLPAIGDGVSIASTVLGGPVVGAATFLVQKLLRNPLDKILTYEYHVSGSWDDPQVVPIVRAPPADGTVPGGAGKGEPH